MSNKSFSEEKKMKNSQFAKIKILQEKIQPKSRVYIGKWLDYEYYVLQWKPLNVITNYISRMLTIVKPFVN